MKYTDDWKILEGEEINNLVMNHIFVCTWQTPDGLISSKTAVLVDGNEMGAVICPWKLELMINREMDYLLTSNYFTFLFCFQAIKIKIIYPWYGKWNMSSTQCWGQYKI